MNPKSSAVTARLRALTMALLAPVAPIAAQAPPIEEPTAEATPEVRVVTLPAAESAPAQAFELDDLALVPDSYWAHGDYGDAVLRNDHAIFIFGRLPKDGEEPNPRRNGTLLDMLPKEFSQENFWLTQPVITNSNALVLQAEKMELKTDKEKGSATLVVTHRTQTNNSLSFVTEYLLDKDSAGLRATTTVRNDGAEPIRLDALGDYVNWGIMGAFLPSVGWLQSASAELDVEFTFGRYYDNYVLVAPADTKSMRAYHNGTETRFVFKRDVTLQPGQSESWSRWFMVGRNSPANLLSEVLNKRGDRNFGVLAGRVVERVQTPTGEVIDRDVVRNADIGIRVVKREDLDATFVGRSYVTARTDENGSYQINLPPGEYSVDVIQPTRLFAQGNLGVRVERSRISALDHGVSPPSRFVYEVVDADTGQPIAAKLTLLPLRGSRPPMLGEHGTLIAENQLYTASGRGSAEVPAGNYRVIASCGNEYHKNEQRLTFKVPEATQARFELKRAFKSDGWVSADLAVRTNASVDSRITPEDRVAAALAEGIDWISTADWNRVTDLSPAIERLGAKGRIFATAGYRFPGEKLPLRGDYVVFPVGLCTDSEKTSFDSALAKQSPGDVLAALKALCPKAATVVMRPIYPKIGYLMLLGGTMESMGMPPGEFNSDFDGFMVWEGKRQAAFDVAYGVLQELRVRGLRPTPFGASNSGGTWNEEVGYPRLYIKSSKDKIEELSVEELVANFKKGLVQVTNGPFIDFTVNGVQPGDVATMKAPGDNEITVDLKVLGPDWTTASTININVNGRFSRQVILPPSVGVESDSGQLYPRPGQKEDGKFRIRIDSDAVVDIVLQSDPGITQDPVNPHVVPTRDPNVTQGQRTLALSAPIYVDYDGDGKITLPKFITELSAPASKEIEPPF